MTDSPSFQADPNADAANLFIPIEKDPDQASDKADGVSGNDPVAVSTLTDQRFTLRANHQDMVLTGAEMVAAAQKGLNYDTVAGRLGAVTNDLNAAKAKADSWDQFQANPWEQLMQLAQTAGLMVGREEAGSFVPLNADSLPKPQPQPDPNSALQEKINQLEQVLGQVIGDNRSSAEESALRASGATDQEIAGAKAIAMERNLPVGSLDMALTVYRSQNPNPAAQPTGTPAATDDASKFLNQLKALGLQVGDSALAAPAAPAGEPDYSGMTEDEKIRAMWRLNAAKKGIQTTI